MYKQNDEKNSEASYKSLEGTSASANPQSSLKLSTIKEIKDDNSKVSETEERNDNSRIATITHEAKRRSSYSSIGTSSNNDFDTTTPFKGHKQRQLPKVGIIKEGFHIFSKSNPISRYNFFINRYNEDINRVGSIFLSKIKIPKIMLRLFDFFTWLRRLNYALFLIILSCITQNKRSPELHTAVFQYYSYFKKDYLSEKSKNYNFLLILYSIVSNVVFFLLLIYFFFVLSVPLLFMEILMLYAYFRVHRANKRTLEDNRISLYSNMIYDTSITYDKSDKMNEYITVLPDNLKDFSTFTYFGDLSKKYSKKKQTIPQQFMLYGEFFKGEWRVLDATLLIISVEFFMVTLIGSLFFFRV